MPELLEDPDGAPYPEAVQDFIWTYTATVSPGDRPEWREALVKALESVIPYAKADAWDEAAEATAEWMANNPGPSGIPRDPPRNPYEEMLS